MNCTVIVNPQQCNAYCTDINKDIDTVGVSFFFQGELVFECASEDLNVLGLNVLSVLNLKTK